MRKFIFLILFLAFLTASASAQDVIKNPAKPMNEKADRVVTLKEEMQIEDTGEGFFFKMPNLVRLSPKGDLFIRDGNQALQFDPQGRFIRNLVKSGQGPGELTSLADIWAAEDRIFLIGFPMKLLAFDYQGILIKETPLTEMPAGGNRFIMADKNRVLLNHSGRPDPSKGSGSRDIFQNIIDFHPDNGTVRTIGSFPIRAAIQVMNTGIVSSSTSNQFLAVPFDDNIIALNFTPEYRVELFSRETGMILRQFNRPYPRVKRTQTEGRVSGPGGVTPTPPEFRSDIVALHVVEGRIWVQTSTFSADKGNLFDVFDSEGRYLDRFYLQIDKTRPARDTTYIQLKFADGFVYFTERSEDETIKIKKCRLIGL